MKSLGLLIAFALLAGASMLNRTDPSPLPGGRVRVDQAPVEHRQDRFEIAPPPHREEPAAMNPAPKPAEPKTVEAPAIVLPKAHDPWRDLMEQVELTEDQKVVLQPIVAEREIQLRDKYTEQVQLGVSLERAGDAVREVFNRYDGLILEQLMAWQQVRYNEARMSGTIGRPMLVYTWGSSD